MSRKIVPDVIGKQNLVIVSADMTVREAAKLMHTQNIGAVMVGEAQSLTGIFTERDLAFKVVAAGRDPDKVKLAEVMTWNPDTLRPEDSPHDALQRMSQGRYRHLPVVDHGRVVGMVSVRDIYGAMLHHLEDELHDREAFIQGSAGYGLN
ncbi:MAG TPA: CBS domain-containing protein [Alphaproteobacteria bacterium]|nr:CBS domain-containing protein [Alphaproteobacteria bacterium]